jgi:hypothetical protein
MSYTKRLWIVKESWRELIMLLYIYFFIFNTNKSYIIEVHKWEWIQIISTIFFNKTYFQHDNCKNTILDDISYQWFFNEFVMFYFQIIGFYIILNIKLLNHHFSFICIKLISRIIYCWLVNIIPLWDTIDCFVFLKYLCDQVILSKNFKGTNWNIIVNFT